MISPNQYRKLRKIHFFNGTTAKDFDRKKELYNYLLAEGLIKHAAVRGYNGYVLTEKGDAEMYSYKVEHFRFWLPTVISLIALIVSIFLRN